MRICSVPGDGGVSIHFPSVPKDDDDDDDDDEGRIQLDSLDGWTFEMCDTERESERAQAERK